MLTAYMALSCIIGENCTSSHQLWIKAGRYDGAKRNMRNIKYLIAVFYNIRGRYPCLTTKEAFRPLLQTFMDIKDQSWFEIGLQGIWCCCFTVTLYPCITRLYLGIFLVTHQEIIFKQNTCASICYTIHTWKYQQTIPLQQIMNKWFSFKP